MPNVRIPQGYRKYLAELFSRDWPNSKQVEVVAPTATKARRHIDNLYPEAYSTFQMNELYGPYLPSEERMIRPRGLSKAISSRLKQRRDDIANFYKYEDPGSMPADQIDEYADWVARYQLENYLKDRPSRLPVLESRNWRYMTPGGRYYRVNAYGPEGVRDRFRLRGVPEDDIGWVEINPMDMPPYGF